MRQGMGSWEDTGALTKPSTKEGGWPRAASGKEETGIQLLAQRPQLCGPRSVGDFLRQGGRTSLPSSLHASLPPLLPSSLPSLLPSFLLPSLHL